MDPQNSLNGDSYTVYINGNPDTAWNSGGRSYPLGTTIRIDYSTPACNVTLNGFSYTSGAVITLTTTTTQNFVLLNADHWFNIGDPQCSGNQLRQPIQNDCGATSSTLINECSCQCNIDCQGRFWGGNVCSGTDTVNYEYYVCNGGTTLTGNVRTVACTCACNPNCLGTRVGTPYCSGTSGLQLQDTINNCTNQVVATNTYDACACACNQTCDGTYWDDNCNGGTTLTRTQRYVCNDVATGVVETYPCNQATCGASTTPAYVYQGYSACYNPGTYPCTYGQVFKDTNSCSPTYNNYFIEVAGNKINVGGPPSDAPCNTTSNCQNTGVNYCSNGNRVYEQYQANPCSNASCPPVVVSDPTCAPTCRIYNIIAYSSSDVTGSYTGCASGSTNTFNYSGGPGTVGQVCARLGTVSVNGGQAQNTGTSCT